MKKVMYFVLSVLLVLGCTGPQNAMANETALPDLGVTVTYNNVTAQLHHPKALPDLDYVLASLTYHSKLMENTTTLPITEFDSTGNYFTITNTSGSDLTIDAVPTYTFDEQGYNKIFYREQKGAATKLTLSPGQSGEVYCKDLANMKGSSLTFPTIIGLSITAGGQKADVALLVVPKGYTMDQAILEKIGLRSESLENVGSATTVKATAPNDSSVKVVYNGQQLQFDTPIINRDGRSFYPLRPLIEGLGGTIGWDAKNSIATANLNGNTVEFTIYSTSYRVNGKLLWQELEVAPFIESGRTYIPIREACEGLGLTVNWDGNTQTIHIGS